MRIALIGASGFIGKHLTLALEKRGDSVVPLSLRDPQAAAQSSNGCDVIVNLAGESVAQRWTPSVKEAIRTSRVDAPRALIAALAQLETRPKAYISASAIGYYGTSDTATFTEKSPPGNDFLAEVCQAWEHEAHVAQEHGMRVAIIRTGLVLGSDGGALAKLLPVFKVGGGGTVGTGRQWYSWIHIDDIVNIYIRAIDGADGILNATAPAPTRNIDFTRALGKALHRPVIVPVPSLAIKVMLGEGAIVVLQGQRVIPERTLELGYTFTYPDITSALTQIASAA